METCPHSAPERRHRDALIGAWKFAYIVHNGRKNSVSDNVEVIFNPDRTYAFVRQEDGMRTADRGTFVVSEGQITRHSDTGVELEGAAFSATERVLTMRYPEGTKFVFQKV